MRATLCFLLVIGLSTALLCPSPYKFVDGIGCIRFAFINVRDKLDNLLLKAHAECSKDGAHLPIIKNQDQNDKFNRLVNFDVEDDGVYLVLDVACNPNSRRIEWVDGTPLSYIPYNSHGLDFDCVSSPNFTVTSAPSDQRWIFVSIMDKWYYDVACVADPADLLTTTASPVTSTTQPGTYQCGDYSVMPLPSGKPCYQVFTASMSWESAQKQCAADFGSLATINSAEENKFFWRTAITYGMVDGMHIGAHQPDSDWVWIDGDVPLDGKTYDNFAKAFPIPGGGSCVTMMTQTTAGLWINEDCEANEQPFICRREDNSKINRESSSNL